MNLLPVSEALSRVLAGVTRPTEIEQLPIATAAGLTLAQIKQILDIRDHGQAPCGHVRDLLDARLADIDAQIADLTTLRDNVAALRDDAALPEPETCSPDQVCRYL